MYSYVNIGEYDDGFFQGESIKYQYIPYVKINIEDNKKSEKFEKNLENFIENSYFYLHTNTLENITKDLNYLKKDVILLDKKEFIVPVFDVDNFFKEYLNTESNNMDIDFIKYNNILFNRAEFKKINEYYHYLAYKTIVEREGNQKILSSFQSANNIFYTFSTRNNFYKFLLGNPETLKGNYEYFIWIQEEFYKLNK